MSAGISGILILRLTHWGIAPIFWAGHKTKSLRRADRLRETGVFLRNISVHLDVLSYGSFKLRLLKETKPLKGYLKVNSGYVQHNYTVSLAGSC